MSIDPAKVREALRTPTFENSIENVERRAIEILKGAGLPTDGTSVVDDRESPEWHAQNVMWRLGRVREQIRRVGDPGADELARLALSLGNAVWTAMYKIGLEPNTALGAKVGAVTPIKGAAGRVGRRIAPTRPANATASDKPMRPSSSRHGKSRRISTSISFAASTCR